MLTVQNRIGIPEATHSGMDSLQNCRNKKYFLNYSKNISYRYNSRGFRDHEWPEDLSDVIWCVGDSFTVGIGQPIEETWPALLTARTGRTTINIGQDGCSNDTMNLRINEICKLYDPKFVVVMWSYLARRRVNNGDRNHDKNDFGLQKDLANFGKNYLAVNSLPTNVVNLLIPYAFEKTELLDKNYPNLKCVVQFDYARDYHHFGVKTSKGISQFIGEKINQFDNSSKYPI